MQSEETANKVGSRVQFTSHFSLFTFYFSLRTSAFPYLQYLLYLLSFINSYNTMLVAIATLSESTPRLIGIVTS